MKKGTTRSDAVAEASRMPHRLGAVAAGLSCAGGTGVEAGLQGVIVRMSEPVPRVPRLRLLGEARCWPGDGRAVALEPKDAVLLAYLAICGPTARSQLATLLWPEVDEGRARATLRQRLYRLRRLLGFDPLEGQVVARLAPAIVVDAEDGADTATVLLAGVDAAAAGGMAAWLDVERERRRGVHMGTLAAEASACESAGRLADALTMAQRIVALDPTSEHGHRRLMRLHYLRGDRAAALAAFDHCCDALERLLGIAPDPETEALRAGIEALATPLPSALPRPLPVSVLRPPRLIGRDAELVALRAAWQEARAVLVSGEAGLGKTRLLEAFVELEADAVRTAGRPGDAAVPFTTLARILRAVLQRADRTGPALVPAVRREISRVLPEWGESGPVDRQGQRFVLRCAVQTLLGGAEGLRGLVVDDLHFADAATLEMLGGLVADGAAETGRALGWLFAFRPADAGGPLRDFQDALLDSALPLRVSLLPLDRIETAGLVDSLALPDVSGEALAAQLLRRTGGNPLFLLETLKQAWADGAVEALASGRSQLRPASVQQLIERRLAQLTPAALTLARVAAVAAPDFDIELAEAVLAQPAMQLASAWRELESAQVLRAGAFAHDLVYETTLASVPDEIARHCHGAVARWLAAHGGEPARVAEHWLAAGEAAQAIGPLREAARLSTVRTCVAEARAFLERAAALCVERGAADDEFAILFDLHQNYIVDDPGAAHERLVERLHALARCEGERLHAAWARHNLRRYRQTTSPIAEVEGDVARAEKLGDERVLGALVTILVEAYLVLDQPDLASSALTRHQHVFERRPQRSELPDFIGQLADILGEQDRFDESLAHLARATELYREAQEPAEVMVMLCNRTRHLRQQGRMVAAQALFEQIDRWHAANAPNPRAWTVARAGASEVLRELGRYDEALRALEQPREEVRAHMGRLFMAFGIAEAKLWLALGQHARAGQAIASFADDVDAPDWLRARGGLVAAQVAARVRGGGEADRPGDDAWRLLESAALLAPRDRRRSAWFECELQRAAWLEPTTGAALAEGVAAMATHQGMPGYAQQARLCAAGQRLAAGQIEAALRHARAAQTLQQYRFTGAETAEPVHPCGGSEAERDLVISSVLVAGGADATLLLAEAGRRQSHTLEQHVPADFRDAFLQRHPVHRALRGLLRQTPNLDR